MGEGDSREIGTSSRHRDGDDRTSDLDRDRHRESSRRHDDERRHHSHSHSSSSSSSKRREKERERDEDLDAYSHRQHHSHRSDRRHSSPDSRHRHRDRDAEDRSESKRRRREGDTRERSRHHHGDDKSRRHESKGHHRRRDEGSSSSHRSKSDHDRHQHHSRQADNKQPATDFIPTSKSLHMASNAESGTNAGQITNTTSTSETVSTLKRDDWMTGGRSEHATTDQPDAQANEAAYFSSFGKERVKAPRPEKPDPEKLKISSRELNTQLREGKTVDEYDTPAETDTKPHYGAPGHQWRMMKLKRTLEMAEQEGRPVEQVALERYDSLDDFEHAKAERRFLDGKDQGKGKSAAPERSTPTLQSVARRSYLLASGGAGEGDGAGSSRSGTDSPSASRPGSRQGFRRPGESVSTPTPSSRPPRNIGFETPSSKPTTPTAIPSVFTPVLERPAPVSTSTVASKQAGVILDDGSSDPDRPILTADQLNKLQAKIFQAELMGDPSLDSLKSEYERESSRAKAHQAVAGDRGGAFAASSTSREPGTAGVSSAGVLVQDGERELQVLPTLDARGRMYDIGSLSSHDTADASHPQKRKKLKGRDEYEARDPTTGDIVRYSADDDTVSLGDLVRQEKFSAGSRWHKDPDSELALNIMSDAGFSADLDGQDDDAHRYAKKKMRSDALKRQFAINDFAKTKAALDRCRYCWQEEGLKPPRVTVVSSGYRAYLAIPDVEAITPNPEDHLMIVPMQHHLSLLEADEETWEEMKNFQKCLVQLAAKQKNKRVVFFETVLSIKAQLHSVMEAVFVPADAMDLLPGVFKQSLRSVGSEWSTHQKVIDFTPTRPFRNALVPNLPYFAVCWDYKWCTGYGHVIENMDLADGGKSKQDEDAYDVEEMSAGHNGGRGASGGRFDPNFARDIIRGVLEDLDQDASDQDGTGGGGYVRSFGKSRRKSEDEKRKTKQSFTKGGWEEVDWTKLLGTAS